MRKIGNLLLNIFIGWLAGILVTLGISFLWLRLYPVIDRTGQGPGLLTVLVMILIFISPPAIIGGFIGGRIPKEGGRRDQTLYAALFGLILTIPFACFTLWYTGF